MDAEHLEVRAAVGLALAAGDAPPTVQIGLHGAPVSDPQRIAGGAERHDLDAQLMPQNTGIGEEGLFAAIGMQVGAADADAPHSHEGFVGAGRLRLRRIGQDKTPRLFENNGLHGDRLSGSSQNFG
jgi:hypothetical protein